MSKRVFITLGIVFTFLISVFLGIYFFKRINKYDVSKINNNIYHENEVKVQNEINFSETISTNSAEQKITPNTRLVLRKYYEECGHTINEYAEMPPELINMTKEELQEQYKDWKINSFSEKEVVLIKFINNFCDEHYVLKELDEYVAIYKLDKNGEESLLKNTSISTRYLTQTDISHLKSGIKVFGKENLNSYLEDFE